MYYACEAAETLIMTHALKNILKHTNTTSVIWLHDGMYINQSVCRTIIDQAFKEAAIAAGVPEAKIKVTNCREKIKACLNKFPDNSTGKTISDEINLATEQGPNNTNQLCVNLDKPFGRIRGIMRK